MIVHLLPWRGDAHVMRLGEVALEAGLVLDALMVAAQETLVR